MMGPTGNHHLHFCGIHVAKKDPRIQIVTQHYCGMVGKGMHQCLLYDSTAKKELGPLGHFDNPDAMGAQAHSEWCKQ